MAGSLSIDAGHQVVKHAVRICSVLEAAELLAGVHGTAEGIPPPGTTLGHRRFPTNVLEPWPMYSGLETAFYVEGVSDLESPSDWSRSTVNNFMQEVGGDAAQVVSWLAQKLGPEALNLGIPFGLWPMVVKGTQEENAMRWIRNTVRGQFGGGSEQWQFKMDFGTPGSDPDYSDAQLQTFADTMRGVWGTWWASLGIWYPTNCSVIEVGAAQLVATEAKNKDGTGGNVESTMTQWASNVLPYPAGTGTGESLPFEVACAVTLQTDHRGPSGRGRFYAPAGVVGCMDDGIAGCFEPGYIGALNAATKAVFDSVRAAGTLEPIVVSERKLILNTITSVATGIVPDSQRRRRRSQDEARVTLLTPA